MKVLFVNKLAKIVDKMGQISQELHEVALHQALEEITLPDAEASQVAWKRTHSELEHIMHTHLQLELDQPLITEQYKRLGTYLEGSKFLLECLELAYLSDREAIYAQLLLPPIPVEVEGLPPVKEDRGARWWVGLLFGGLLFAGWLVWWVMFG